MATSKKAKKAAKICYEFVHLAIYNDFSEKKLTKKKRKVIINTKLVNRRQEVKEKKNMCTLWETYTLVCTQNQLLAVSGISFTVVPNGNTYLREHFTIFVTISLSSPNSQNPISIRSWRPPSAIIITAYTLEGLMIAHSSNGLSLATATIRQFQPRLETLLPFLNVIWIFLNCPSRIY